MFYTTDRPCWLLDKHASVISAVLTPKPTKFPAQALRTLNELVNSEMAKKRKAGGRPFGNDETRYENNGDSKLRVNTYEDVADSEDEFHINRDKVLLEENLAQKRLRRAQEEGLLPYPDEEHPSRLTHVLRCIS